MSVARNEVSIYNREYNLAICLFFVAILAGVVVFLVVSEIMTAFYIASFLCVVSLMFVAYYMIRGNVFYIRLLEGCDFFIANRYFIPQAIPYLDIQQIVWSHLLILRINRHTIRINPSIDKNILLIDAIYQNNKAVIFARKITTESQDIIAENISLEENLDYASFRALFENASTGDDKNGLQI